MSTNTRVTANFDGKSIYITEGSVHALDALAKSLVYEDHRVLTCYQGGWRGSSSYSGNTHGKEAFDLSASRWREKLWNARRLGIWLDHRLTSEGPWEEHLHGARLEPGATYLDPSMSAQQREYLAGGDGLIGTRPDDDRRPRYPDVRFVDDRIHERWIAVRDTTGYSQGGGHASDAKVKRAKGFVWSDENIATVRVKGADGQTVEWLVSESMTFYRKSDFNAYVPGFVAKTEKWTVSKEPCYGRVAPGPDAAKKATRAIGFGITSIGYVMLSGVKYVVTSHGTWYTATSLKARTATAPETKPVATSFNATVATQNVIARRMSKTKPTGISDWKSGADYANRVGPMAAMLKGFGVSLVATQEAGSKDHSKLYDEALEAQLGGDFTDVLYGDGYLGGDISQTVTFNAEYKLIRKGYVTIVPAGPGSSHDNVPWAELEHVATGIRFVPCSTHAIAGSTTQNAIDRGMQIEDLIPKIEEVADGLPILWLGDWNSAKADANDAVGKAFARAGYVDAEDTPCAVVHAEFDSYNGLDNPPRKKSKQLDRAFAKPGEITFRLRVVVVVLTSAGNHKTPWPSDHQPVVFEITVYRK